MQSAAHRLCCHGPTRERHTLLPAPHVGAGMYTHVHTYSHTHVCTAACHPGCLILSRALQWPLKRPGMTLALAPSSGRAGTYHHVVDVVRLLHGHVLVLFAFSTLTLCKHAWETSSSHNQGVWPPAPTAATMATQHRASQRPHLQEPGWVLRWSRVGGAPARRSRCQGQGPGWGTAGAGVGLEGREGAEAGGGTGGRAGTAGTRSSSQRLAWKALAPHPAARRGAWGASSGVGSGVLGPPREVRVMGPAGQHTAGPSKQTHRHGTRRDRAYQWPLRLRRWP